MTWRNTHAYVSVGFNPREMNCAHGTFTEKVRLGSNTEAGRAPVVFVLHATRGRANTTRAFEMVVGPPPANVSVTTTTIAKAPVITPTTVATATTPTTAPTSLPPVKNLNTCVAGSADCYYGPIYATYQTYGNRAPDTLGDCTFAAAANWEQVVLSHQPNASVIGYEFAQAGGTASGGLAQNALWSYWQNYGIDGIHLTGMHLYYHDQTDVENGVRAYGAMIVEFSFVPGTYFGYYQIPISSTHDAIVDGYTPEGPLVVSWGETIQMTWQQWNAEVIGMWGIGAS